MTIISFRKNIKKFFILVCITALLASCVTPKAKIIFDDSIAVEKSAWICPGTVGTITGYNGIEVKWKVTPFNVNFIQIPAGDTLLEWDVNASMGNTIYRADNILFRYNFLPGKQYYLVFGHDPEAKEYGAGILGVKVYMYDIGETINGSNTEMEKHFYGFAPFLNLDTRRRTVLE